MRQPSSSRGSLLGTIVALWLAGVAIFWIVMGPHPGLTATPVVVTHWANGHMMNKALLPHFAEQFKQAGHKTKAGKPIIISFPQADSGKPVAVNSGTITDELIARVNQGATLNTKLPDPTIVTPAADHWLSAINYATGRPVFDLAKTDALATTYIGIATYREMAECLGWPQREIGFADVVALRADPRGWAVCPKAKAEWGQTPLISFTDPNTSSTGRSMLFALYAIGAGKPADQLSQADVRNLKVVDYIKSFQRTVDHYVYDTLTLNSKIYLGPRYGHLFFIPEDDLVHLYQGKLAVTVASEAKPQPLSREMVFIYPKEGAIAHNHSAALVQANWVSAEQVEAAEQWIAFLREEAQQRAFMGEGFRPPTGIPLTDPISGRFGLDPQQPKVVVKPDAIDPAAAAAIVLSWDEVKKPGIVTFVVDVSASMNGAKIEQAKQGLIGALDGISKRNSVGLLAFGDDVVSRVPVAPLAENRFVIADAVRKLQVTGATALYDAIKEGIEMTDAAPGEADDAIRGVVVATDGRANRGRTGLDGIISLMSTREQSVRLRGFEDDQPEEEGGRVVEKRNVVGTRLALKTRHPIHVFFIGIGSDADMEIGRMLAEATGSAFKGATEKDLAQVLEAFGKHF